MDNNKSKNKKNKKIESITKQISDIWQKNNEEFSSDMLGSYTGTPKGNLDPEQDADDL